ncbi:MAG: peptide ABC transporter substrate-binding protein [Solirubrobacterales bacterium]|nr:peptide ABC transporter substrate-binding protein [Solirubrobacterales bacterium]
MRTSRLRKLAAAVVAVFALLALSVTPALADESGDGGGEVLRIGWAQDPQTLNPFIGLDEESYTIWAINWDLLVNFNPEDLSPSPGIAESWEVSDDRKTVTFKIADRKWSDGKPVTSADVKWTLETLGEEGELFTSYTDNVTSIRTPDPKTVVIQTSKPDARIVGGLLIYILPKHIWGKVPLEELTTTYQPSLPLVGTGPYIVTEFDRGRQITMQQNQEFSGKKPNFSELQFIKYGNQDAVERGLQLGEIDLVPEVQAATFERLGEQANVETVDSPSPAFTQLAFNLCPPDLCPDANFNPAIQDLPVRQAIAYSIDRERINQIAASGTSFVANGLLPSFYRSFYQEPDETYEFDPEKAKQILDDAGYVPGDDGIREKDGDRLSFNLYTRTRSESAYNAQAAKLVAEMAREVGIEFNVQEVSVDKLTELTVRHVDGKPAPDFDAFIWGWGGDAYDPSFLLSLMTTGEIGGSSDAFYSNEEYDQLYAEQSGEFDVEARKEIIARMINRLQEDLPYIVLTEDPNLQAYRTDRIANVEPACPSGDGDIFCEQAGYAPLLDLAPASESTSGDSDGGGSGGIIIAIIAVIALALIGFFVIRSRRRRDEPLELEEEPLETDPPQDEEK